MFSEHKLCLANLFGVAFSLHPDVATKLSENHDLVMNFVV